MGLEKQRNGGEEEISNAEETGGRERERKGWESLKKRISGLSGVCGPEHKRSKRI